ncbi:acyl-CoA thioesterase [Hahella ganghwensis]|uniref:acyl-CoA thioesterase n=1 Tax=Hahella ganghwensis TaxID=286420 RepID=UPI00036E8ACE|nr:thioesterase family protein [Hahella ganghwensis]
MTLQEILTTVDTDRMTAFVPEHWGQGRATFGGLIAAIMFERIPKSVTRNRPLRSLLITFAAPIAPGQMHMVVTKLREGKSATQIQVTSYQNDQVCSVMMAGFGDARESSIEVTYEKAPMTLPPSKVQAFPFIPNLTPEFTDHFDYRYTVGKMPFMGSRQSVMGGWIKQKSVVNTPISIAELLALTDAWPPATFSMMDRPAAGSTLSWTINFIDLPEDKTASDWWQYEAHIQHAVDGYSHIDASIWDDTGSPVAISRQTVCIFG